ESGQQSARSLTAERMTGFAAIGLHEAQPLRLALHRRIDSVALWTGSRKFALGGRLGQGVPVVRRIVLSGGLGVRRRHRVEIESGPGRRFLFGRIDQAVAAGPDIVVGLRQFGNDVAAAVVGDNGFYVTGAEVGGFGDDPDAGFGSFGPGDDSAD